MDQIGIATSFGAGVLSFLSPCVLPIIPGYLSFLTGLTAAELASDRRRLADVIVPAALFVLGFSIVFMALGASASAIGQLLGSQRQIIERIAGVALVAFGVLMLGIIRVPWLYGEARFHVNATRRFGAVGAVVMGMAFAAGWTPCVGPILGSILTLAASSSGVGSGVVLLAAYSAGLGVPFMLVAILFGRMSGLLRWMSRHALVMNRVAGAILVALGVLVFTGQLGVLSSWLVEVVPSVPLLGE